MLRTLSLGLLALAGIRLTASAAISASVDPSGRFLIDAPEFQWTFAGDAGAPLNNISSNAGTDGIGQYAEVAFDYTLGGVPRHAAIRTYAGRAVVLFSEQFLAPGPNTRHFPRFDTYPHDLHVFGYGTWEFWFQQQAIEPGSPWLFFDNDGKSFVISPAANFIVARIAPAANGFEAGIDPAIPTLDQNFAHATLLALGNGINAAFDTWGRALTDLQGKVRPANDADVTLARAGYWTDNGAPYYYNPGDDGANLVAVQGDSFTRGIRFGYVQADSWWYLKGVPPSWHNVARGIYRLRSDPDLFPDGLSGFQQRLGLPLVVHSRYWHEQSPDRAEYAFSGNVPVDPRYWNDLAAYLADSGVRVYEQDWLSGPAATAVNIADPEAFFSNMAAAMAGRGIDLQYCMPRPRHFLQGSKYSNLTSIRASADHFSRARWDSFLFDSRLASALGIWPFTDNFFSTDLRSVLLAVLSAGPFGPSDPIGQADADNLRHALRADGIIVKPDLPLVPTDASYLALAQNLPAPMIASTSTDFGNGLGARYVFAYDRKQGTSQAAFSPAALGIDADAFPHCYVYDYFAQTGTVVDTTGVYTANVDSDGSYFLVVPIGPSGMAFLGDESKFASLGKKRIASLDDSLQIVTATVRLAHRERFATLLIYSPAPVSAWSDTAAVDLQEASPDTNLYRFRVSGPPGKMSVSFGQHAPAPPPGELPPPPTLPQRHGVPSPVALSSAPY